jgi:uncharacterized protein (TIGR03437 family)
MTRANLALLLGGLLAPMANSQIENIAVRSAASFAAGLPSRGSLGTIFCTGLVLQGVVAADKLPLPAVLSGVQVTIGGAAAPLLAVADLGGYQQVNFRVPEGTSYSTPPTGYPTVLVIVSQFGTQGSTLATYNPLDTGAFFTIAPTQHGIFQHSTDYSLVTADQPASPGETLIGYLTGLPTAEPVVPDGEAAPVSPLSTVPQTNTPSQTDRFLVYVGPSISSAAFTVLNSPASPIMFLGLAPGLVGVYQVNFTLPESTHSGLQEVQIVRQMCNTFMSLTQCASGSPQTAYSVSVPVDIYIK